MRRCFPSRRTVLAGAGALTFGGALAKPYVALSQPATLKITGWGGKWGEVMKAEIIPAFEREHKCTVVMDQSFPFLPKLLGSSRSSPIYDVYHASLLTQWETLAAGLIEEKVDPRLVPNVKDLYPYATNDKIVGVGMFVNAIGLGYRSDRLAATPRSWKELWDPAYAGNRGMYVVPANALGAAFLMWTGQLFGSGYQDLDAAFAALEKLKPVRLVDFTGAMEKQLISGEVSIAVLHDSGIYRYHGENLPLGFVPPTEGVLALEQVISLVRNSPMKELGNAFINHMLSPPVQRRLAEAVWYAPANRTVTLDPLYQEKLLTTGEKVAKLVQVDWKFYVANRVRIDARFNRLFRA